MRARMRVVLAAIDGSAYRNRAVVVEHQVRMASRAAQPALNSGLRFGDGGSHGVLRGVAVGVCRSAGDAGLALHSLAQFVVSLPHMLAQNVSAGSLVLAQIAPRTVWRATFDTRSGRRRC